MANNISDKSLREKVLKKYDYHCAYCGKELTINTLTIDHIIPKFRKYSDEELLKYGRERGKCIIENFNPCCMSCNSSKSTFTIEQWRNEILKKHERLLRDSSTYRLLNRFQMVNINHNFMFYFERIDHGKN